MSEEQGTGGWGFTITDAQGQAIGAGAGFMQHVQDPLNAEAMACFQSLQAAQSWGLSEVHVQTDASTLVQALTTTDHDMGVNGILFREIKCFARLNFN
uniref:RNase H type-1 domain-containing protein n=1 Tax=Triticum urartu TaxID=4572 RepID=A0A8R7UVX9_TRIUA